MNIVQTFSQLPETANNEEVYYCSETKQFYIFDKNKWKEQNLKPGNAQFGMTQYELNKTIISQMPPCDLIEARKLLYKYTHKRYRQYFMLLCNDIHYYTVLDFNQEDHDDNEFIVDLIIELLQAQGEIKSINYNENKSAIECWVNKDNDILMFMLFDYDWGVLECQ